VAARATTMHLWRDQHGHPKWEWPCEPPPRGLDLVVVGATLPMFKLFIIIFFFMLIFVFVIIIFSFSISF